MATEAFVYDETFPAAADMRTTGQFLPVAVLAAGVSVPSAATTRCIGVLQNAPNTSEAAQVRIFGISKGISDGSGTAILVGDLVGPSGTGIFIKKTTADFNAVGVALDASSAAGVIIRVMLAGPAGVPVRTLAG